MIRTRRISWLASFLNLYLLLNGVRALHAFQPLGIEDYAITDLASATCLQSLPQLQSNASTGDSKPHSLIETAIGTLRETLAEVTQDIREVAKKSRADDLATIMRTCRSQLAEAQPEGLSEAKLLYWHAAYGFICVALCLDVLRWCGCCSMITDAILGFRSPRMERFRLLPQLAMLLPFGHVSWLLSSPIELPCCEGTPKMACVLDRVRVLAWLSILVTYCLFADAHNQSVQHNSNMRPLLPPQPLQTNA